MSTKPRTREHFPRMKVRGGQRRHGKCAPRDLLDALFAFARAAEVVLDAWQKAWLGAVLSVDEARARRLELEQGSER